MFAVITRWPGGVVRVGMIVAQNFKAPSPGVFLDMQLLSRIDQEAVPF
jgi:hypothetical protein